MQANQGKRPKVILAVLSRALTTSCVVYKPLDIVKNLRRTYYLGFLICACAAANLAIGTRNGEQET